MQRDMQVGPGFQLDPADVAGDGVRRRHPQATLPVVGDRPAAAGVGIEPGAQVGQLGGVGMTGHQTRAALADQLAGPVTGGIVARERPAGQVGIDRADRTVEYQQPPEASDQHRAQQPEADEQGDRGGGDHTVDRSQVADQRQYAGHKEGNDRPGQPRKYPPVEESRAHERGGVGGVGHEGDAVEPGRLRPRYCGQQVGDHMVTDGCFPPGRAGRGTSWPGRADGRVQPEPIGSRCRSRAIGRGRRSAWPRSRVAGS